MLAVSALAGAGLIGSPRLLGVWIVPVLLGQPALRLYVLAEHGDCPRTADCFETMRTTFTSAALRGLACNRPSHAGHHPAPPVPFHALPALHRRVRARPRTTAPGHVAVTRADLPRRP
jgi:fatty acid desaturase